MEIYKLEKGILKKYNGGFVVLDNKIYTNPDESTVRKAGYKDLVYDEKPEYDEKTHYLESSLEETETEIRVRWVLKNAEELKVD